MAGSELLAFQSVSFEPFCLKNFAAKRENNIKFFP
jgi:hypothetical protein